MRIRCIAVFLLICLSQNIYADHLDNLAENWSDAMITTKIKTQFTKDRHLNPLKISVKTKNGVVTIKGHAKNREAFVDALRIVSHTKGVHAINTSEFDILSVNSAFKDAYITAKIEASILKAKVLEDESIPLVGINASTVNGIVTLSGTVKHKHSVAIILKHVHHIRGVKQIKSNLMVAENT